MTNKRYGYIPDRLDFKDRYYAAKTAVPYLPSIIDLRPDCPPVYDQGDLGSCTANAIGFAYQFIQAKQKIRELEFSQGFTLFKPEDSPIPSRLFIYYNEREMEGTIESDAGAMIVDGIKSIADLGVCSESMWPYDIESFRIAPPVECYSQGLDNQAIVYERVVQDLVQLKTCLAAELPIVFGFAVYSSFESREVADSGIVPLPKYSERRLGGHAVTIVGYKDDEQVFIVRNSWGSDWGDAGYCYMPYSYLLSPSLSRDFWVLKAVE